MGKSLDTTSFSSSELIIKPTSDGRELIFSPLGNKPKAPVLALVGITPGGQSEKFETYIKTMSAAAAAEKAAFEGAQTKIKAMLQAHGFSQALGVDLTLGINNNPAIWTTSLVKCCVRTGGSYKFAAPDIETIKEACFCFSTRFRDEVQSHSSLTHMVIFGEPGWTALTEIIVEGETTLEWLTKKGLTVLKFPHFAQNYQQQKIFCQGKEDDEVYFSSKPRNRGYLASADSMRSAVLQEVSRLAISSPEKR